MKKKIKIVILSKKLQNKKNHKNYLKEKNSIHLKGIRIKKKLNLHILNHSRKFQKILLKYQMNFQLILNLKLQNY